MPLALVDCAEVGGSQGRDRAPGAGVGSWALEQPTWLCVSIWRAERPAGDPLFSSACGRRVTEDRLQARQGAFLIPFQLHSISLLTEPLLPTWASRPHSHPPPVTGNSGPSQAPRSCLQRICLRGLWGHRWVHVSRPEPLHSLLPSTARSSASSPLHFPHRGLT